MRQRGFTIIELVVTIGVMALIMMIAMPNVTSWLGNTQIRNLADSLQNGLQIARAEAVRRNQSVSFWLVGLNNPAVMGNECALSGSSGSWVVSLNSPVGHCADAPSVTAAPLLVTARAAGNHGILVAATQLASPALAGTTVTFDGFGRVSNTDAIGVIDVTGAAGARGLRVAVSSAGQVRVCDPLVADPNDPRKC
jgi:type IV fimbrial biogenesis protein FimT